MSFFLGAKLSILLCWWKIVRCQIIRFYYVGAKLSGAKLSWCQIVLVPNCPVPNFPVPKCPSTLLTSEKAVFCKFNSINILLRALFLVLLGKGLTQISASSRLRLRHCSCHCHCHCQSHCLPKPLRVLKTPKFSIKESFLLPGCPIVFSVRTTEHWGTSSLNCKRRLLLNQNANEGCALSTMRWKERPVSICDEDSHFLSPVLHSKVNHRYNFSLVPAHMSWIGFF